mmetsp:Transcript_20676/g.50153  ORF Transcript_20676/g.50153 Transcript_20676/m.50153 type:complete len:292 (+) Transcript_20676:585-1460(+)
MASACTRDSSSSSWRPLLPRACAAAATPPPVGPLAAAAGACLAWTGAALAGFALAWWPLSLAAPRISWSSLLTLACCAALERALARSLFLMAAWRPFLSVALSFAFSACCSLIASWKSLASLRRSDLLIPPTSPSALAAAVIFAVCALVFASSLRCEETACLKSCASLSCLLCPPPSSPSVSDPKVSMEVLACALALASAARCLARSLRCEASADLKSETLWSSPLLRATGSSPPTLQPPSVVHTTTAPASRAAAHMASPTECHLRRCPFWSGGRAAGCFSAWTIVLLHLC